MQTINFKSAILPKTEKQLRFYESQKVQPSAVLVEFKAASNRHRRHAGTARYRGPLNRVTVRKMRKLMSG